MRFYFLNFAECPRCAGCAHYKQLTSQRKHSPKVCHYALDVGAQPGRACPKLYEKDCRCHCDGTTEGLHMVKELNLYNDLRKTQTLLNCLESVMIHATAGSSLNDHNLESFDLLYLLLDHVGRMVDKAGGQVDRKEGAA